MERKEQNEAERLARGFAIEAHDRQVDRAGNPYWLHLATVAGLVEPGKQRAAAWLHDVLEDTDRTRNDLERVGVDPDAIEIVAALTRVDGETYQQYIERVAGSGPDAIAVKRADLADHLGRPAALNAGLETRYRKAVKRLDREQNPAAWPCAGVAPERIRERHGRHIYESRTKTGDELRAAISQYCTEVVRKLTAGERPEEQEWALVRAASSALDLLNREEREKEPEGAYAEVIHPRVTPPERGVTLARFPTLGMVVLIDEIWALPERGMKGPDWVLSGLKLTLFTVKPESSAAPRKYDGGFYGTWKSSEELGHAITAEEAWLTVLSVHGTGGRATAEDRQLREILDARAGRHYAERVLNDLMTKDGDLKKAVQRAGRPGVRRRDPK